MIAHARIALFALCIVSTRSSRNVVISRDPCNNIILLFNTTSNKGDMTHEFKLPSTGVLFFTKNDSSEQTLTDVSGVKQMGISTELGFFQKQWLELRRFSSMSSLWKTRLQLLYSFNPVTKTYNFSLWTEREIVANSDNGRAVISPKYTTDKIVLTCANGIAIDKLKHDSQNLATKWKAYCERIEMNRSRTTPSSHTPIPTRIYDTFTVKPTRPSNTSDADVIDGLADTLSAAETGSIVTVVLLAMVIAPVAIILWRWRGQFRRKFERISTW